MKTTQNTILDEINILKNPNTETMVFRYLLASSYCKNKIVADCSCGYGYGSAILQSLGAKEVHGYDIDKTALNFAKQKFTQCEFREFNLIEPSDIGAMYDTVVSIETFEHLPKDKIEVYLNNLKNKCIKGGKIFITTPRRLTPKWHYNGGTHLYEYNVDEFKEEINKVFPNSLINLFGIKEERIGEYNQLISVLTDDIDFARIMCAVIEVDKN